MDPVNTFIIIAAVAWISQIILGWFQIRVFNHSLSTLADHSLVRIGRSQGRFAPRVVLALGVDCDNYITDNFILRGLTVFSRPKIEARLLGLKLEEICPASLFPKDKALCQALELAITNRA